MRPLELPSGTIIDADKVIYITKLENSSKLEFCDRVFDFRIAFEGNGFTVSGSNSEKLETQRRALISAVFGDQAISLDI